MQDKILIFIPAYNCAKQLPRVIAKFTPEIQKLFAEIIVVENRSTDKTLTAAKDALNQLSHIKYSLLQNHENYSLGGSHKVAFNYAIDNNFDYIVVLHGDDQVSIEDLVPHIHAGAYKQYDSFLGSRFAKGSKLEGYSRFRTYGNFAVNLLCSVAAKRWITDMGAGLNMYKISYLKSQFYLPFPNNLTFNVYLLFYGVWVKSDFKFFSINWIEDDQISNAKVIQQGIHIIKLIIVYFFCRKKIFTCKEKKIIEKQYSYTIIDF